MKENETMSDSALLSKVREEYDRAKLETSSWLDNRSEAFDYYYGRLPLAPKEKDKSKTVSMDVQNVVDSTLAEVRQSFRGNRIGQVLQNGSEDLGQSLLESQAINCIYADDNPGGVITQNLIFDSLLQRNCIAKITHTVEKEVEYEDYEGVAMSALPEIFAPTADNQEIEIESQNETTSDEVLQMRGATPDGEPIYDLRLRRTTAYQKVVVDTIPLEEFTVNNDHKDIDLAKARFVCHRRIVSASDLIEDGYDPEIISELKSSEVSSYEYNETVRRQHRSSINYSTSDDSNRNIEIFENYYRIDYDNDGVAEIRRIVVADNQILDNEPYPFIPFAAGSAYIIPHTFEGMSLYDKQKSIQDQKTGFLRSGLDNAYIANRQRTGAIKGQVDMERLLSGSSVVPMNTPNAVVPLPFDNVMPGIFSMMEYLDKMRAEGGGNAIKPAAENQPVSNVSAHAVERNMSKMEMIGESVSDNLSKSIFLQIFRLIHLTMRHFWEGPYSYQIKDQNYITDPSKWPRRKIKTDIGLSTSERNKKLAGLNQIIGLYEMTGRNGLKDIIFNEQNVYKAVSDLAYISGFLDVSDYWIDPRTPEAQQAKQQRNQEMQQDKQRAKQLEEIALRQPMEIQQLKTQGDIELGRITSQNEINEERVKAIASLQEKMLDIEHKYDQLRFEMFKESDQMLDHQEQRELDLIIKKQKSDVSKDVNLGKQELM